MALTVRDTGGGDFDPIPQGTHLAVCNLVADLGVQPGGRFAPRPKVYLRWEIPGERIRWTRDGQEHEGPAQIGKQYTASLATKARLRADLENWRGRGFTAQELAGFDLFSVLGAACQLVVVHTQGQDGRVHANIGSVIGLPRGMERPRPERPLIRYSPEEPGQFSELPTWLQERVRTGQATPETVATAAQDFDDDIPF